MSSIVVWVELSGSPTVVIVVRTVVSQLGETCYS